MQIQAKDQRTFKFKFITTQQLDNSFFAIMNRTQITRHSNLFAYKYLEGMNKLKQEPQLISMNAIKAIVY